MIKKIRWERYYDAGRVEGDGQLVQMRSIATYIDFWAARTNFSITTQMFDAIEFIPGIETLEVGTRYSIRLGIPNNGFFNIRDITTEVNEVFVNTLRSTIDEAKFGASMPVVGSYDVFKKRDSVDNNHSMWDIVVWPNGQTETFTYDTSGERCEGYEKLLQQHSNSGCILMSDMEYSI